MTGITVPSLKLLPKQILPEEYQYYSLQSVEELREDMLQLLQKTKGWKFSLNLFIEFFDSSNFRVRPEHSPYHYSRGMEIDKYESSPAIIVGDINQNELNQTQVNFVVRPNWAISFFFFFHFFVGLSFLIVSFYSHSFEARIIGSLFAFVGPLLMLVWGAYEKRKLKNRFIKVFELKSLA